MILTPIDATRLRVGDRTKLFWREDEDTNEAAWMLVFPRTYLGSEIDAAKRPMRDWAEEHTPSLIALRSSSAYLRSRRADDRSYFWSASFTNYTEAVLFMLRWSDHG